MSPHDPLARLVAAVEELFWEPYALWPNHVDNLRAALTAAQAALTPLAPSDATLPQTIEQAWHALESRRIENARLKQENEDLQRRIAELEAINGTLENVGDDLRARLAARERERDTFQAGYLAEADMRVKAEARVADTPENLERVAEAIWREDFNGDLAADWTWADEIAAHLWRVKAYRASARAALAAARQSP